MAAAALVRGGSELYLVLPGGRVEPLGSFPWRSTGDPTTPPDEIADLVGRLHRARRPEPLVCDDRPLAGWLAKAGVAVRPGTPGELRPARDLLPRLRTEEARRVILGWARSELARQLASPAEVLIVLAREEERLERAAARELSAQEEILTGVSDPLRRLAASGERLRGEQGRHLAVLRSELDSAAQSVAPNLRELLGASLAGRLVAAAGSVTRLATMSSSRLQLLGTRRRPSPTRGPRYGHIIRAPRMSEVPPDRQAAYARSLAALAVIAARADAFTHRRLAPSLEARRDRRVAQLQRRR